MPTVVICVSARRTWSLSGASQPGDYPGRSRSEWSPSGSSQCQSKSTHRRTAYEISKECHRALPTFGLFHDFDDATSARIDQDRTVVHDGVAIVAYAVFLRYV